MQNELQNLLHERINAKNISQNELASQLGVSNGTISNILTGKWERIKDSMITYLLTKLRDDNGMKIYSTQNFQTIYRQCDRAREYKKMICITGEEGTGKTLALVQYERNYENTYKVHCLKTMRSKEFLTAILFSLGESFTGTPYQMTFKIAETLNKKHKPVLLFDEISEVPVSHLIYLKHIFDLVENNCGIVLCGQPYFLTNLEKAVTINKIGMPEFYSRIGSFTELDEITRNEIEFICKENGIVDYKQYLNLPNFRVLSNVIKTLKENQDAPN